MLGNMRVKEIFHSERDYWDKKVAEFKSVHPLNAFGWGNVRVVDGWKPVYLIAQKGETITGAVMVLTKPIPFTFLSIMYAPRGPILTSLSDIETLDALLKKIRIKARENHAIFIRIDPSIEEEAIPICNNPFIKQGFIHLKQRWTFWNTPRDVYRIALTKFNSEEELFRSLDKRVRTSVRKFCKQGLIIKLATEKKEFQTFYSIFRKFSIEKGFMARGYEYQKALWDEFIARGNGELLLAIYQGKIIGGAIRLIFGQKCLAMHRAIPHQYQYLRANDAITWESIRRAMAMGCQWYSFRGVGSSATEERFKKKYGPQWVSLTGYYDLPFYPFLYRLFYLVEFEILPRVWPVLMRIRKKLSELINWLRSHS